MTYPTGRLEDVGSIVGNHVDAVELGEGLCRHGDEYASPVPPEHLGVGPLTFLTLEQDVHLDVAELLPCSRVVDVAFAIEIGNHDNALLILVGIQQPSKQESAGSSTPGGADLSFFYSRRLSYAFFFDGDANLPRRLYNDEATEAEQSTHHALHEKRDPPREVALDETAEIIHPHRGGVTNDVTGELNTGKLATVVRRRNLGLVDGHNGRQSTDAKTSDEAPEHQYGHAVGEGLKRAADKKYDGTVKDGPCSADYIAHTANYKGRDKGADFENSHHGANTGPGRLVEIVYEVGPTERTIL